MAILWGFIVFSCITAGGIEYQKRYTLDVCKSLYFCDLPYDLSPLDLTASGRLD